MSETQTKSTGDETRREFLQALVGLGVVGGAAVATWSALEFLVPAGNASEWHKSVCRYCGTGCGIQVGLRDGKVVAVRGDEQAHNKGVICVKGSTLPALPYVPGRLLKPKVRKDGRLVETTWDEAMNLVAARFKEAIAASKDAVAFYGSGQLFTEESYTANKLFKAGIGTNNVDGNPRLCMASAAAGYVQTFGKDEPCGSYADIDHADCFFLMGANPFECHPPLFERIRQRKRMHPATKILCVDPRRTRTAELSDVHLPVIPGTDLLLLNAMAQVVCADGLHDRAFIDEHVRFSTDGKDTVTFADFKAFLDDYTPEKVADQLGVSAATIRDVAYLFARSKATMSLWTMGVNQRTQGVFLNTMLNSLHLITGQICRPGATPLSLTGQANACGGVRDTGALSHLLPGGRSVTKPEDRAEMEKLWGVAPGTLSNRVGHDAVNLFRAMETGDVKACLVMCTNPAQSLPSAERYRKAMQKCFLVVAEAFEDSETAELASVLLPSALWIEKEGVFGQTERRYQLIEKLLDPPGEARSDLAILVDLAQRLGHGGLIAARTPSDVWDEWRHLSAHSKYNFEGITHERLRKERGLQWPCPTEDHPGTVRRYVGGDDPLVAPGKKIEFYGTPDHRAVVFLRPYRPAPEQPTPEYPYLLTTGRVLEQWHTGTMTGRIPELAQASGPGQFELNEQDAFRLRVRDGDRIEVTSRFGSLTGIAKVTRSPRQGVLFAPFYDARFLINRVVADHYDAVSREPEYKVTAVQVRKAEVKS
jgi:nitrate reductase NapA